MQFYVLHFDAYFEILQEDSGHISLSSNIRILEWPHIFKMSIEYKGTE